MNSPESPSQTPTPVELCDTTMTPRAAKHWCACQANTDLLGPCFKWKQSPNGRCVYCDHDEYCHKMIHFRFPSASPAPESRPKRPTPIESTALRRYRQDEADAYMDQLERERDEARLAVSLTCELHGCGSESCTAAQYHKDAQELFAKLAAQDALLATAKEALENIHNHHMVINARRGRPLEESLTASFAYDALAALSAEKGTK